MRHPHRRQAPPPRRSQQLPAMEATPQHLDLSDAFLAHAVKAWFAVVALAVSFTTAFVLIL